MTAILVEFFGSPRLLTGVNEVRLDIPSHHNIEDIVYSLAKRCPELIDQVIKTNRQELQESYIFNLNGLSFLRNDRFQLEPDDRLLLFSNQAGG